MKRINLSNKSNFKIQIKFNYRKRLGYPDLKFTKEIKKFLQIQIAVSVKYIIQTYDK